MRNTAKALASLTVTPLLLCGAGAMTYLTIRHGWNLNIVITGMVVFTLLYLYLFERIIPLKPHWEVKTAEIKPDIYHFLDVVAFDAFGKISALIITLRLHQWLRLEWDFWNSFSFLTVFLPANLIGEFIPYWYHRISHIGNERSSVSMFLWRTHAIHHIPQKMNLLKTNWMHPVNMFVNSFGKTFPLLFLGFSRDIIFAVGITNLVVAYLSHANIRASTGLLDYVIATPRVHHYHHSVKPEEAKNYSNILPFWDIVFGTYFNRGKAVEKVGFVEGTEHRYPSWNRFVEQMKFPFQK